MRVHTSSPTEGQPLSQGAGIAERWFARPLADTIHLPGILQAQGYGDLISTGTPWVLTLGDAWWKLQPESLRERFSQPGHVEVPFLAQPPRHYLGAAWYQRDISIPDSWREKVVTLVLERPHWETRVWIDALGFPADASLVAPHLTRLGVLKPGRHVVTIRVDNRRIINEPTGNNHMEDAHSVSDALGAAWNGIVGKIELSATPPVWIDSIDAFPDVAQKSVRLRIGIGNATGNSGSGILSVGKISKAVSWDGQGGVSELEVALPPTAQVWDEFHPVLQHLSARLLAGSHGSD